MLIDMHAHTSGISRCCKRPAEDIVEIAKNEGIDGIVVTNHYQIHYIPDGDTSSFAKRYVEEYRYAKECGDKAGVWVLLGAEVTMEKHNNAHLLIYGIDEEFIFKYHDMFTYTQEELYRVVKAYGGALIQAHPMRLGENVLLDLDYIDGIEINSHQNPKYDGTHIKDLSAVAKSRGLILTAGGDFHADSRRPLCGAYLPDGITGKGLAEYLLATDRIEIRYQEPFEMVSHKVIYDRKSGIEND